MIKLENNWEIESTPSCYVLRQFSGTRIDKKTGEEITVYKNETYHEDLLHSLARYKKRLQEEYVSSGTKTIDEVINFLTNQETIFEKLLKQENWL